MTKKGVEKIKITDEKLQEMFAVVEKTLNRDGHTASSIAEEIGVNVTLVNRVAGMLRKAGREIPRSKHGLKKALETYMGQ